MEMNSFMKRSVVLFMAVIGMGGLCRAGNKPVDASVYYVQLEGTVSGTPVQAFTPSPDQTNPQNGAFYLNTRHQFQTISGFGGAFNENGGEALASLGEEQRKEVLQNLFGAQGAGFTFCRMSIGASDFGLDAYSYSEVADDFEQQHFSIERDDRYVVPYIKGALAQNPSLKIFASPWSPPAWMKTNGKMAQRGRDNELIDSPEIYRAYALYFRKFVEAYRQRGIDVSRICIQNETDTYPKFPGAYMSPKQMITFGGKYLVPEFKKAGLDTEIYAGTFRGQGMLHSHGVMANAEFRQQIDGLGFQYCDGDVIREIQLLYPGVPVMHTEGHCYNGANSWEEAKTRMEEVAEYLNAGTDNYCYWNMILNETGKSAWNWRQNCLINIDRKTGEITYNPDFAVMSLCGRFIRPGARRIEHAGKFKGQLGMHKAMTALLLPDGNIVALLQNPEAHAVQSRFYINEAYSTQVVLPGNSVCAVVFEMD